MASRRNSSVKIYVNGKLADGLYGLSKRVGQTVSRYSQASQRAQASLARKAQPVAKAEIRKLYTVKPATLNDRIKLETGTRKQSDYISLWASTRRISLIAFAGRWGGVKTPGAVASILLGQPKTYDSAFIASIGWRGVSGATVKEDTVHRGIYVRRRGPDGKRVGRGPVRRLYGPSAYDMLMPSTGGNDAPAKIRAAVISQLQSYYVSELSRQIAVALRGG